MRCSARGESQAIVVLRLHHAHGPIARMHCHCRRGTGTASQPNTPSTRAAIQMIGAPLHRPLRRMGPTAYIALSVH
ncbi:hypothetical protein FE36_08045 [Xanthomonas oryzae pv. oryzicola]|nr:hypothetical protein FE36_08045 [Xanthomonas oryzae pv. oryzicola]AKO01066.1 hypothetical protein ACU15_11740 [Xanthomonas oryzae pv. oryzicola]KOR47220.1 hypothetical protein ADT27_08740 [Xanthomonas oryzae]